MGGLGNREGGLGSKVMERALHWTLTASCTTPLPPDLKHVLYLVWAFISLPVKWVWKVPTRRLQCESALCSLLSLWMMSRQRFLSQTQQLQAETPQ